MSVGGLTAKDAKFFQRLVDRFFGLSRTVSLAFFAPPRADGQASQRLRRR